MRPEGHLDDQGKTLKLQGVANAVVSNFTASAPVRAGRPAEDWELGTRRGGDACQAFRPTMGLSSGVVAHRLTTLPDYEVAVKG